MANTDNPRTGAEFERQVQVFFAKKGHMLQAQPNGRGRGCGQETAQV
jgi:hypothetical protein